MRKTHVEMVGGGAIVQPVTKTNISAFSTKFVTEMFGGDFYNIVKTSNGQQVIEFSEDPINNDTRQSSITSVDSFKFPADVIFSASTSVRNRGMYFTIEATTDDNKSVTDVEYTITAISQSGSTLSVTVSAPVNNTYLGDLYDIKGLLDSRFNYPHLILQAISLDKKTLSFTNSDENSLPSLTATPASVVGGILVQHLTHVAASNIASIKYSSSSATQLTPMVKYDNNDIRVYGVLTANQGVTSTSSNTLYVNGTYGEFEHRANNRLKMNVENYFDLTQAAEDANVSFSHVASSYSVKPDISKNYYFKMRSRTSPALSRFRANIKSITKSGTTTATVVTDRPHGLSTTDYIYLLGVRDITNFPSTNIVQVASVTNTVTFTVVMGSAVTATSYGGFIGVANGGLGWQNAISAVSIQSVTSDASTGLVQLTSNAAWGTSSGTIGGTGEIVNLYGVCDSAGNSLNIDGVYRVSMWSSSSTLLVLEPILDLQGNYVKNGDGINVTPPAITLNAVSCGGTVVIRPTIRLFDIIIDTYKVNRVKLNNENSQDYRRSLPVHVLNVLNATAGQGSAATLNNGAGGWFIRPSVSAIADVTLHTTDQALTAATVNGAAIANDFGNGFQIVVNVTVYSNAVLNMDFVVEESFDGGTTFVKLYDMQRINGTGVYYSPLLRATGRHYRLNRIVSGTGTTNVRYSVTRNLLPFIAAEPQKRMLDRTIVLTTQDSVTPSFFQGVANNVQLVLSLGACTTPPTIQLEGSEDNVNFFPIGTTLQGVPSKTVEYTLTDRSNTYIRAKCVAVGSGVTLNYVSIKTWS